MFWVLCCPSTIDRINLVQERIPARNEWNISSLFFAKKKKRIIDLFSFATPALLSWFYSACSIILTFGFRKIVLLPEALNKSLISEFRRTNRFVYSKLSIFTSASTEILTLYGLTFFEFQELSLVTRFARK